MPFTTPPSFAPGTVDPGGSDALWFAVRDRRLLLTADQGLPDEPPPAVATHFLGSLDGRRCLAVEVEPRADLPEGMRFVGLRGLFARLPDALMSIAGRAVQVVEWGRTHRYCGACATPTEAADGRRALVCPSCGLQSFPRLAPAIIVAVERGDELLLARSPHFPPGIHSTLAGFVDAGESAEEAVCREVREEAGVEVRNIRYFGSQPWPFPHSLMLGYQADYAGGEVVVDGVEIETAGFYRADALPPTFPGRVSISQWLIRDFLNRHRTEAT